MKNIGKQIILVLFITSFAFTAYAGPTNTLFGFTTTVTLNNNNDIDIAVVDREQGTLGDNFGYLGSQYSGYYIGTVTKDGNGSVNDDEEVLEALIQEYFADESYEVSSIDKIDIDDGEPYESGATTILIDSGTDSKSGSWELSNSYVAEFYTVKAATEFALYYVDPEVNSGLWWTGHLLTPNGNNIPGISHFSAVYTEGNNQPPENLVPEPATMILMGVGLLGLGFGLRKKNQQ